jgi:copper(I)-binding protein
MRTSTKSLAAGFCVTGLLLAGCGSSSDGSSSSDGTTSSQSTEVVAITDAWVRTSAMGTTTGVVYLEITATEDDELISASVPTDIAATTEIHQTTMEEMPEDDSTETTMAAGEMGDDEMGDDAGNMTMSEVEAIELPAGETVMLEPGSYHIMMLELVEPLEAGQSIKVTLEFKNAGTKTVSAEVRDA